MTTQSSDLIQFIDDEQEEKFNAAELKKFCIKSKLEHCGVSYVIVSIIGPQSSGKSTLLNCLFGTSFRVMDAQSGRYQVTKGIWISKSDENFDLPIFVMDLEGTDGAERGADNTLFERQSALFALAVSDIVLINIWNHDIGREIAANKPLLKMVFEAMIMKMVEPRKITLMFVIRDLEETPLEVLDPMLREDMRKIWDGVPKPSKHKARPLDEFFNIQIEGLPNYKHKKEHFEHKVSILRQRFSKTHSQRGLLEKQQPFVEAKGFVFSSHNIWKSVQENNHLDLPAHNILVASFRCEEIAKKHYTAFMKIESCQIKEAAQSGAVTGFGKMIGDRISTNMTRYHSEAEYFNEGVRLTKGKELQERLLLLVKPAFQDVLEHFKSTTTENFRKAFSEALNGGDQFDSAAQYYTQLYMDQFDKGCKDANVEGANWDTSKVREELRLNIGGHIAAVGEAEISKLRQKNKKEKQEMKLKYAQIGAQLVFAMAMMGSSQWCPM